jgi:iron(III) transport system substrate-binding protein
MRVSRRLGRVPAAVVSMAAVLVVACGVAFTSSAAASTTNYWGSVTKAPKNFSALVKAAKAEGSVTIATPIAMSEAPAWVAFEHKYGIKVNAVDQSSAVVGSAIPTQESSGKVTDDLVAVSNFSQLKQYGKAGYFEKYTPLTSKDYRKEDEIPPYAYPLYQTDSVIAWNTKTTPQSVQKQLEKNPYKALLSPSLKGRILLLDANNGGSGMAWFSNLVYNVKGYGWPYLTKLAAQDPAFTGQVATIAAEVESGTYDVTNFGALSSLVPAIAAGAPVKFVAPSPCSATQFMQAIVKGAPHPAAARLFQEWSFSHAGQERISQVAVGSSILKGWINETTPLKKLKWYKPPAQNYLKWQFDPRLQGTHLTAFLAKWSSVFHHSN